MIYFDMNIYNRMFDDQSQRRIRLETLAIDMRFMRMQESS
jgi:hypothetical protein